MDADCLGSRHEVSIDGRPCTLALPVLESNGQLGSPPGGNGEPLALQLENRVRSLPHRWGYAGAPGTWYVKAVAASMLLPSDEVLGDADHFNALQAAFVGWSRTVVEWAAAWSQELLMQFETDNDPILYVDMGDKGHLSMSDPRSRTDFVRDVHPLNHAQLTGALRRASREDRLPVEHAILLSAEDARAGGDLRQAAIDAATAAEVAYASFIRERLKGGRKGLPAEFIEEMIKDANGIANLHALCRNLGGEPEVSKNKLVNQLANVRNQAAHAGETPTADETATAIRHAMTIVRALRPLPLH